MTTFYDKGTIRITERWLHIGNQRYAIDQLHNLRVARGPANPPPRRIAGIAGLALPALGLIANSRAAPALAVLVLALAALTGLAVVRVRLRSRPYLLWADYQGSLLQLYHTQDQTEFGKVSRALVRASTDGRVHPGYVIYQ